jgi:hypothetical protein
MQNKAESTHRAGRRSAFRTVHARAAGLDVGATFHVVAVSAELSAEPVRTFQSFTSELPGKSVGDFGDGRGPWSEITCLRLFALRRT